MMQKEIQVKSKLASKIERISYTIERISYSTDKKSYIKIIIMRITKHFIKNKT